MKITQDMIDAGLVAFMRHEVAGEHMSPSQMVSDVFSEMLSVASSSQMKPLVA